MFVVVSYLIAELSFVFSSFLLLFIFEFGEYLTVNCYLKNGKAFFGSSSKYGIIVRLMIHIQPKIVLRKLLNMGNLY